MKLQKQLSRKVGNKEYNKWVVVIPPRRIDLLGWEEGEYLESEVNNQALIIRRGDPEKTEKRSGATKKAWKSKRKREENE